MNFKPGDKVWYQQKPEDKEIPDVVIYREGVLSKEYCSWCEDHPGHHFVGLQDNFCACTSQLRRRDDGDENNKKGNWENCVWQPNKHIVVKDLPYVLDGYKVEHP